MHKSCSSSACEFHFRQQMHSLRILNGFFAIFFVRKNDESLSEMSTVLEKKSFSSCQTLIMMQK